MFLSVKITETASSGSSIDEILMLDYISFLLAMLILSDIIISNKHDQLDSTQRQG